MNNFDILVPILAILVGGAVVLMPLAALCARFALKPILEAIAEVRGTGGRGASAVQERRLEVLEAEVQNLRHTVQELNAAERFRLQLEDGRMGPAAR